MAEQAIGKYSVDVTKKDGMKSTYFVLALSLGGAEMAVLENVYNAEFALATAGWPAGVKSHDLFSRGAASVAVSKLN